MIEQSLVGFHEHPRLLLDSPWEPFIVIPAAIDAVLCVGEIFFGGIFNGCLYLSGSENYYDLRVPLKDLVICSNVIFKPIIDLVAANSLVTANKGRKNHSIQQ